MCGETTSKSVSDISDVEYATWHIYHDNLWPGLCENCLLHAHNCQLVLGQIVLGIFLAVKFPLLNPNEGHWRLKISTYDGASFQTTCNLEVGTWKFEPLQKELQTFKDQRLL